jgi:hypothetical protein
VVVGLDGVLPQLMSGVRNAAALIAAAVVGVALHACTQARGAAIDSARADSIARARQDSINRTQPGYVIDSVLPLDEELRRFRAAIGASPVTELRHASPSRDALVRRAVAALSAADTTDLHAMAITSREFADLVFPSSPFTHPPYRQPIGLAWQQLNGSSAVGAKRLLRRMGGRTWRYAGHDCATRELQGPNTIWSSCDVRVVAAAGDTLRMPLFGSIIEHAGRFKVVGFR